MEDDNYDSVNSPDTQGDEGDPSLLGASEPQKDISGGGQITSFVKNLADTGSSFAGLYNSFRNPNASAATAKVAAKPPTVATPSFFAQNKNILMIVGALVVVLFGLIAFRKTR